jgi:hypothetical protein
MSFVTEYNIGNTRVLSDKEKKDAQAKIDKLRLEDEKMVKVRFINHHRKGAKLEFTFKKYKEHPYRSYSIADGQVLELPMMVVNHINNDCTLPKREYDKGENGVTLLSTSIVSREKKYECVPVNFM